jgi:hypothetical protein
VLSVALGELEKAIATYANAATRDLCELLHDALGPDTTVSGMESARRMVDIIAAALAR